MVYSFVFVAIDTREQNAGKKISFAGLPVELKQFVHFAVTVQGLNPRIGLYRTEYVQPMDYEPLSTGGFHGDLVRNAEPVQQEDSLTEWVSQVMLRETAIEPVSIPPVTLAQLGKSAKKAQKNLRNRVALWIICTAKNPNPYGEAMCNGGKTARVTHAEAIRAPKRVILLGSTFNPCSDHRRCSHHLSPDCNSAWGRTKWAHAHRST